MNKAAIDGLKEYQEKVKAGLIEKSKPLNPIEKALKNPKSLRFAINAKCYECSNEQRSEVTYCKVNECPLYNLRPYQVKG